MLFALIAGLVMGYVAGGTAALKNRSGRRWGIPLGCAFAISILAAIMVPSQSTTTATVACAVLCGLSLIGCLGGLVALSLRKPLCPQCAQALGRAHWKEKACPQCGSFSRGTKSKQTTGLDALVVVAGIILSFLSLRLLLPSPVGDRAAIVLSFMPLVAAIVFVAFRTLRGRRCLL